MSLFFGFPADRSLPVLIPFNSKIDKTLQKKNIANSLEQQGIPEKQLCKKNFESTPKSHLLPQLVPTFGKDTRTPRLHYEYAVEI